MRDADVRRALRGQLHRRYVGDDSTIIIEELGLCRGTVRVDIAVVNGTLNGYEIKSAQDTLTRLPLQAATYNRIFDTMTIVAAERHLRKAEALIPGWWGIQVVTTHGSTSPVVIQQARTASPNLGVDPSSLVQLLWREEVLELLDPLNRSKSLRAKPRRVLWNSLAQAVPLPELKNMVFARLKSRPRWRVDAQRKQDDEMSQPCATL